MWELLTVCTWHVQKNVYTRKETYKRDVYVRQIIGYTELQEERVEYIYKMRLFAPTYVYVYEKMLFKCVNVGASQSLHMVRP